MSREHVRRYPGAVAVSGQPQFKHELYSSAKPQCLPLRVSCDKSLPMPCSSSGLGRLRDAGSPQWKGTDAMCRQNAFERS